MRPELQRLVEQLMPDADDAVVVDFESFYDDKCSVKTLGNEAYTRHSRFDCYLVTIFGRGVDFVGHPSEAPWQKIKGRRWVNVNVPFDSALYKWCQEKGAAPADVEPSDWVEVGDLCSFFGYPRDLAGASRTMFGIHLNKDVRNVTMKGRYWWQFSSEEQKSVTDYAGDDAVAWAIYQKFYPQHPQFERDLSTHTLICAKRGVAVDLPGIEEDIQTLNLMIWKVKQDIPWVDEEDEKGKPFAIGSPKAIARACDKAGVPVPETTSIKKEEFQEWLDLYGAKVPALMALSHYRRLTRQLAVYQSMKVRVKSNGRLDAGLKYYGAAATGRWAGWAGVNLQNFLKVPIFCDAEFNWLDSAEGAVKILDVRSRLVPGPGKKFIIADKSQIEPRVLNWVVGNEKFLQFCRDGQSPYEAAARAESAWTAPESLKKMSKKEKAAANIYALFKARVIALGYQSGWRTFIDMAALYVGPDVFKTIFHADVTQEQEDDFISYLEYLVEKLQHKDSRRDLRVWNSGDLSRVEKNVWVNSWLQVTSFRKENPLLSSKQIGIWNRLDKEFKDSGKNDPQKMYEIGLPSGRSLFYFDITDSRGWQAKRIRGEKSESVYGGLLTENMVQAIARDDFGFDILSLEPIPADWWGQLMAGTYNPRIGAVFHVHDECIAECDPDVTCGEIVDTMRKVPAWAAGLPVDAEAEEATCYKK